MCGVRGSVWTQASWTTGQPYLASCETGLSLSYWAVVGSTAVWGGWGCLRWAGLSGNGQSSGGLHQELCPVGGEALITGFYSQLFHHFPPSLQNTCTVPNLYREVGRMQTTPPSDE